MTRMSSCHLLKLTKSAKKIEHCQKKKDKTRREMEVKGLEGKNNECRLNNERRKEKGQKRCYEIGLGLFLGTQVKGREGELWNYCINPHFEIY